MSLLSVLSGRDKRASLEKTGDLKGRSKDHMSLEEYKGLKLPNFQEVCFGEDKESKREAIKHYDGRLVLIKDLHKGNNYHAGRITFSDEDKECYHFVRDSTVTCAPKGAPEERLWYHDLQGLLVPIIPLIF